MSFNESDTRILKYIAKSLDALVCMVKEAIDMVKAKESESVEDDILNARSDSYRLGLLDGIQKERARCLRCVELTTCNYDPIGDSLMLIEKGLEPNKEVE